MNWTDQMQQFMGSWTEAQRTIASQWTEAMHQSPSPGKTATGDWAAQWRELAAKNYETRLTHLGGVPGSAAQRMFSGAQAYHRFVDLIAGALGDLAPKVQSGAAWTDAITQYMDTIKGKMGDQPHLWMNPASAAAKVGDASELWRLFLDQARSLSAPWVDSLGQARSQMGEAMGGDHRALAGMANLFTDTFESTLGKLLGSPAIGYSREHQEKLTETFEAWVDVRKSEAAFTSELTAIGFRSVEAFVNTLAEKGLADEKIESPRKLFDLWVEVAEKTYFEAASTEAFAQTQANLVNASMRHRLREKTLVEGFYKAVHLPTRQEVDDAYKHMHELRTQVKKLTKTVSSLQVEVASLRELRREPPTARGTAAKAPARPTARKTTKIAGATQKTSTARTPAKGAVKATGTHTTTTTAATPASTRAPRTKAKEA